MRTTFGPDHLCPTCEDVFVYWWVGTRGETRLMEVEHCRPHTCAVAQQQAEISRSRCPDCGLSTYRYQDELYDEDAALVHHQCAAGPVAPPTPPAPPPPRAVPFVHETLRRLAGRLIPSLDHD